MAPVYWIIAFVIFVGIELPTMALTTIWFAGGALAAFVLSLLGADLEVQLAAFVIISFVLLFFTRPVISRYVNRRTTKTNVDSIVGRRARVTKEINNVLGTGVAMVDGQEWTARALRENDIFQDGDMVYVREIQGVKLIVDKVKEEE